MLGRKETEVAGFEDVEFRAGQFVWTREVAGVGQTDAQVSPDDHEEEECVEEEEEDCCVEGEEVAVCVAQVGDVDAHEEDVEG